MKALKENSNLKQKPRAKVGLGNSQSKSSNDGGGNNHHSTLEKRLEGIHTLLSHLHGEVTALEQCYSEVLSLLHQFKNACDTDDMTGLLRKRSFFDQWKILLNECEKLNEECGLMIIDIDHFKLVNDTHGHPTGDVVIQHIAGLLKQYTSPVSVVGRFGGEEFVIASHGSEKKLKEIAERIRTAAESNTVIAGEVAVQCTVSIGIASTRTSGFETARLLKRADEALYQAKQTGRNNIKIAA